jgi:hypothetical protein
MSKVKNVSGRDLVVPWLGGRLVFAGQEVEVPAEDLKSYTAQESVWAAVKDKRGTKADADDSQEG